MDCGVKADGYPLHAFCLECTNDALEKALKELGAVRDALTFYQTEWQHAKDERDELRKELEWLIKQKGK